MPDVSTACTRLQEADQAYHDLMRGQAVRSIVDENGESMAFTQANKDSLLSYIRTLQAQCPAYQALALGGSLPLTCAQRDSLGPLRFFF